RDQNKPYIEKTPPGRVPADPLFDSTGFQCTGTLLSPARRLRDECPLPSPRSRWWSAPTAGSSPSPPRGSQTEPAAGRRPDAPVGAWSAVRSSALTGARTVLESASGSSTDTTSGTRPGPT